MLEVHMRMHGPGFYKAGRVEESMSQTFEHKVIMVLYSQYIFHVLDNVL